MEPTELRIVILLNSDADKTKYFDTGHGEFPYGDFLIYTEEPHVPLHKI